MILIVIYFKLKVKQALYKLKCDKVPLIVIICIESLTTKLAHCAYHNNTGVCSIQGITQLVLICFFFNKG